MEYMIDQGKWVFYLKLTKNLPKDYIKLNSEFHKRDKSLIPISISNLLECTKNSSKVELVIVIRNSEELRYFYKKVRNVQNLSSGRAHY